MSKTRMLSLCALLLVACSDGGSVPGPANPPPPSPVAGAKCDAKYGNAPAALTNSADGLLALASLCQTLYGESLSFTDREGTARAACLVKGPGAAADQPLPLLVWLHPSLFPMDSVLLTELPLKQRSADLSGDSRRPGFSMLLVAGRDTEHFYPFPDNTGLGWDNWYRNLDRGSPALNVDVETIDHFIATVKDSGIVDPRRVYLSGWSNGSAMAELYGLNTPGIAAAAVYSSPNPFNDSTDPCPQSAFGNNRDLALLHVGNQCDIIGICDSSEALLGELARNNLVSAVQGIRVGNLLQEVQACSAICRAPANPANIAAANPLGTANHLRWPLGYTDRMLEFLRDHPLR